MRRFFSMTLKTLAVLTALLLIILVVCIAIGVTLDLSFLRPGVETSAKLALGRDVKIEGPVLFEFSTWPAIEVRDIKISNPPGFSKPVFFKAGEARLKVALFPLLRQDIRIAEIIAKDVTLNLENNRQGQSNWLFNAVKAEKSAIGDVSEPSGGKKTGKPGTRKPAASSEKGVSFSSLDHLSLKNIRVNYFDAALGKTLKFHLDEMSGEAPSGRPILLKFKGNINRYNYSFAVNGDPIEDFTTKTKPWAFSLAGKMAGKEIKAKGDFMTVDHQPQVNLAFSIKDIDVGAILSALGIVEGLDATVGDAGFKISLNGSSLKQVLQESSMIFGVRDAKWKVSLPNTRTSVDITDLSGIIRVEKGNAVTMDLKGKIDQTPVALKIMGSPLVKYVTDPKDIPLTISAKIASTQIDFSSKLALPMSTRNMKLGLKISGEKLNDLDDLLKLDLPSIGPIFLDSRMEITASGYNLTTLKIKVGKSKLTGSMNIDTSAEKPKADIKLISDLIRIDDFDTRKGAREKRIAKANQESPKKAEIEKSEDDKRSKKAEREKRRRVLSKEVLGKLDANVKIEARQVTSGKDKLGSAFMTASLEDSRLLIDPLKVNIPGGSVDITFSYLPGTENASIDLQLDIDNFDFGILARRAKPDTDMGGTFSLKAGLHSSARNLKQMMSSANGRFDFMLEPKNFSAGIIDLWAVNLISAIINKESEKEKSRINCLVVRMEMKNGVMKEKAIYMDTSKMRIAGKAKIDFKARQLDILLVPKAKRPEFFSLATPVKVHGSFDDFGIGIGIGRLAGTVISFITSPVHVPIRRIFSKKVAANGYDACLAAWTLSKGEKKGKSR